MNSKLFSHLCLLIIFLLGNTISCAASLGTSTSDGLHREHIQQSSTDDCCPKDGHKKQIDGNNIGESPVRQNLVFEPYFLQVKIPYNYTSQYTRKYISLYIAPIWDRQSLFFTDTIRLLI